MKKVFHLSTCQTCRRILEDLDPGETCVRQDVKKQPISPAELDALAGKAGSYEALFNRQSQQYKALNLKERQLSEADYRQLILDHYTFLKRPLFVLDGQLYAGNSPKTVAAAKAHLQS